MDQFRQNHVPPLWVLIIPVYHQISTWFSFSFILLMFLMKTNWYIHNLLQFCALQLHAKSTRLQKCCCPDIKIIQLVCSVETLSDIYSKCSAELVYLLMLYYLANLICTQSVWIGYIIMNEICPNFSCELRYHVLNHYYIIKQVYNGLCRMLTDWT